MAYVQYVEVPFEASTCPRFPATLFESNKLPNTVRFVVVAFTKRAEVAVTVSSAKLLLKITLPLKTVVPLKVVSFNVEDERVKLFPVPELSVGF